MSSTAQPMEIDESSSESNGAQQQPTTENAAPANKPPSPQYGLQKVSPRTLSEFENGLELVLAMFDSVVAHQHLYEDAGILHGDINSNTIILIDREDGKRTHGALVDYDMPLTAAAMRKLQKPDRAVPPPTRYRQTWW